MYIIKNIMYKNLLDTIHIISLITSLVSIILWIINVIYIYYQRSMLDSATMTDNLLSYDAVNHYLSTADALKNYQVLTAFNVLFYFVRFIKILGNYLATTDIFLDT